MSGLVKTAFVPEVLLNFNMVTTLWCTLRGCRSSLFTFSLVDVNLRTRMLISRQLPSHLCFLSSAFSFALFLHDI